MDLTLEEHAELSDFSQEIAAKTGLEIQQAILVALIIGSHFEELSQEKALSSAGPDAQHKLAELTCKLAFSIIHLLRTEENEKSPESHQEGRTGIAVLKKENPSSADQVFVPKSPSRPSGKTS